MPYSRLNHRDVLAELLTWEHIDIAFAAVPGDEGVEGSQKAVDKNEVKVPKICESHLLGKFDKYMQEKEDQNKVLHDKIK